MSDYSLENKSFRFGKSDFENYEVVMSLSRNKVNQKTMAKNSSK